MKIVDVSTTVLLNPGIEPVQYGTSPKRPSVVSEVGRLFVHIKTDGGFEGLGVGQASPGVREVISNALRPLLIDADPMDIRQLWMTCSGCHANSGAAGLARLRYRPWISASGTSRRRRLASPYTSSSEP